MTHGQTTPPPKSLRPRAHPAASRARAARSISNGVSRQPPVSELRLDHQPPATGLDHNEPDAPLAAAGGNGGRVLIDLHASGLRRGVIQFARMFELLLRLLPAGTLSQ